MPRIRSTKPEFYLDPDVQSLSLAARFLFQAMWCQADDRGRLLDHPQLIAAQAFAPTDRVKPEALLAELATGREPRILRYEARGKRLIAVRWFRFHQVPSKPQESRLPPPPLRADSVPFQGWTRDEYSAQSGSVPVAVAEQDPDVPTPELGSRNLVLGSRNEELGSGNMIAPAARGREPDLIFETLAEATGYDWHHLTPASRGELNQATKALREAGDATPDEIRYRAEAYRLTYPSVAFTPSALAKHWPALANGQRTNGPSTPASRLSAQIRAMGGE